MSYQPKSSVVAARALEAQSLCAVIDISTASAVVADCAAVTASGAIITKAVVLDVGEPVAKCLGVRAHDQASGAIIAANSAPVVSGNTITVSLIGTAHSAAVVEFIYIVA